MANAFYSNLQATATKLLKSKGQLLTFTRKVQTAFVPSTGLKTTDNFTYTGYGATFNYKNGEITGESVQMGDIKLLLNKADKVPAINDEVTINNDVYRLLDVQRMSPGGVDVYYVCNLRR